MSGVTYGVFSSPVAPRFSALIVDVVPASADHSEKALAASGASSRIVTTLEGAEEALRTQQPELIVVDLDFGGSRQGLVVAEMALRTSSAAVVLLGSDFGVPRGVMLSERCHLLQTPVHARQLRTTIAIAIERRATTISREPVAVSRPSLEAPGADLRVLDSNMPRPAAPWNRTAVTLDRLRPRERQIVELLLQHYRVPTIAQSLGISAHTVRNHLKNIYRRFGLRSQQDLLTTLDRN